MAILSHQTMIAVAALSLAAAGVLTCTPLFWSLPPESRSESAMYVFASLASYLPAEWAIVASESVAGLPHPSGRKAIVSGNCSTATQAQVRCFEEQGEDARALDITQLAASVAAEVKQVISRANACWDRDPAVPLLVYSTAKPATVQHVREQLGAERSAELVEETLSWIARALVSEGVGQLIIAGGETSGVCVRALQATQMQIGAHIDPGVPWFFASLPASPHGGAHIALKSGNYGSQDFFRRAFTLLADAHE